MTRKQLMDSIKDLPWKREDGYLRCATGDCPIVAAHRKMFPELYVSNGGWVLAAQRLKLSFEEAQEIVKQADAYRGHIEELENR
jgi:hypothetical protein